jgi:hypothetical protein
MFFSVLTVFLLWFWALLSTAFKAFFYHFTAFLLKKKTSPTHPNSLANSVMVKTAWRSGATS